MQVTRVLDPASGAVSFTLLDENGVVAPAERYLRYLADIERSPNTMKAHAHDLKDWFTFLSEIECDWQTVRLEEIGAFIRWLRRPRASGSSRYRYCPRWGITAARRP